MGKGHGNRNARDKNLQDGMSIGKDRLGRFRYRIDTIIGVDADAVRRMQLDVLDGLLDDELIDCRVIAHLILFDGICHLDDVYSAVANLSEAYHVEGQCVVDWLDKDGRQNRRILGPLTRHLKPWLVTPPSKQQINDYLSRLATLLYRGEQQPASRLLQDFQSYYSEAMPGAMFSHVAHLAPITALPRTALARMASRMSLVMKEREEMSSASAHALGMAIDHVMQSDARRGGTALIDRIISICHQHSRRNDARDKRAMLDALIAEAERVGQTDGLSALLLAWVIDFVESGGLKEKNPRPQTIEKYVRNVLRELHAHLAGRDIFQLTAEEYMKVYVEIIDGAKPGNRTHSITGLKTWHAFLVDWFDVPRLMAGLDEKDSPVIPKANMIWPHEIGQMLSWIESSQLDERLRTQLDVCIRLAADIRLRATELFTLRQFNVRLDGQIVEVEVAPQSNVGSLKTDSARRVQVVRDPDTILKLRAWVERREREGALRGDYLFGDPYHPDRVYRLGSTYLLVNRLLKRVTGDATVSLHTLSHTWASQAILKALTEPGGVDVPPLELIANAAGHRSAQTTLTQYFHFPVEVIRHCLDQELSQLEMSSKAASRWTGVKDSALRKRASERKLPGREVYWSAIFSADVPLPAQGPEHDLILAYPTAPEILGYGSALRWETVIQAMGDLATGTPHEQLALRLGIDPSIAENIHVTGQSIVGRLRTKRRTVARRDDRVHHASFAHMHELGIDFTRLAQPRWVAVKQNMHAMSESDLPAVVKAWITSFDRGYLNLADTQAANVLFRFLHSCQVPSLHLALGQSCEEASHLSGSEMVEEASIAITFERWFRMPPKIEWRKTRRSRPRSYLIWSGVELSGCGDPASASVSLAGFHALMLGMATYLELVSNANEISDKEGML